MRKLILFLFICLLLPTLKVVGMEFWRIMDEDFSYKVTYFPDSDMEKLVKYRTEEGRDSIVYKKVETKKLAYGKAAVLIIRNHDANKKEHTPEYLECTINTDKVSFATFKRACEHSHQADMQEYLNERVFAKYDEDGYLK